MIPQKIRLVQDSVRLIAPRAQAVSDAFYATLLQRNPQLQPLFARTNFATQGQALMWMIVWAVERLNDPDALLPKLRELGQRHVHYGVRAEHYDLVGEALLSTLDDMLGADFTPELREAWASFYLVAAETMLEGERQSSMA
jgi:hemoglobin-like flavoprotein